VPGRELAEEIGMRPGRSPTWSPSTLLRDFSQKSWHVYVAYKLSPHRLDSEEEDLEVVRLPLARARALVGQEIVDAKSIIGLLLASDAERRHDPTRSAQDGRRLIKNAPATCRPDLLGSPIVQADLRLAPV